jgi:GNAT superfamily N-acetyltransferase
MYRDGRIDSGKCSTAERNRIVESPAYSLRSAALEDSLIIARHRASMFMDMGLLQSDEASELTCAAESWLPRLIARGEYVGWLFECDGHVIAGAGALLRQQGPVPGCLRPGKSAHIVNVYTERPYRRKGLARRLMGTALEWCRANQVDHVTLSASAEGRSLYESLGFRSTPEMKLA